MFNTARFAPSWPDAVQPTEPAKKFQILWQEKRMLFVRFWDTRPGYGTVESQGNLLIIRRGWPEGASPRVIDLLILSKADARIAPSANRQD